MSSSSSSSGGVGGDSGGSRRIKEDGLIVKTAYGSKSLKDVTCIDIFDRLWYCGTPMNQLDALYRTGETENCANYAADWVTCMKASTIRDEKRREVKIMEHLI